MGECGLGADVEDAGWPPTFKEALLPMASCRAGAAVVLKLSTKDRAAIEMPLHGGNNIWRDDICNVSPVTDAGRCDLRSWDQATACIDEVIA